MTSDRLLSKFSAKKIPPKRGTRPPCTDCWKKIPFA